MNLLNFENSDDLKLKTFSFEKETVNTNEDIIRSIKDENGRLMKLLQEKDFEINKLKKDLNKPNIGNIDKSNLSDGAASMKIIELSKKIRETTSELESFKTKYNQKQKENKNLENEIIQLRASGLNLKQGILNSQTNDTANELKVVKDKLKISETKVLELLTTNQNISKDYKVALKVLEDEIGDPNMDINKLLTTPSNWRGRAQKIITLNQKIDKLSKQLKDSQENECGSQLSFGGDVLSGATSIGMDYSERRVHSMTNHSSDSRQSDFLGRLQRERQLNAMKKEQELHALNEEYTKQKQICDGLKSRNQSLANDIKSYKQQIKNMLDKAKNDDELIASLIQRQDQLKTTIQSLISQTATVQIDSNLQVNQAATQSKQDIDTIGKLKEIIELKEREIENLRDFQLSKTSKESEKILVDLDFEQLKISAASFVSEIGQLRQILKVNDKRYQELMEKFSNLSEQNSLLKQNGLQLEREIQKLTPNSKFKSKFKSINEVPEKVFDISGLLSNDVSVTKETVTELQDALSLRLDKIDSLNNALQLISLAKQEDVIMLTSIIDQTRNKFLESIKKLKNNLNEK